MMKIAINGFGRIGRNFLRAILEDSTIADKINVAAINIGPAEIKNIAHLFEYDTLMGKYPGHVSMQDNCLIVDDHKIPIYSIVEPKDLPWKKLGIDWVVDSSGRFRTRDKASMHIQAGAKKVLVSAPMEGEDITIIPGVNDNLYDSLNHDLVSLGSCTSNALIPLVKVLHEDFQIKRGFMTTIHAYTNDQVLLDVEKSDLRRARAAALNIIPTSTGATKVLKKVLPDIADKIQGLAIRVPVAKVSLIDLVVELVKEPTAAEVNQSFKKASEQDFLGILDITYKQLVSTDFSGNSYSVVVDGLLTQVESNLTKVIAWYDNEWAYSVRMKNFLEKMVA